MIYIVRHGQTDWNVLKKVQGQVDVELNETGIKQAEIIRDELVNVPIDLIISSPLIRARKTAEIINMEHNLPIIYDERIMERNFGKYEGMELKNVDTQELWDYYINKECNEAETIQELFQRVYSFYDEILDKYPDKNILVVTHGGVSIPTHCYFNNYIPEGKLTIKEYLLDNCQVKTFTKKNI